MPTYLVSCQLNTACFESGLEYDLRHCKRFGQRSPKFERSSNGFKKIVCVYERRT